MGWDYHEWVRRPVQMDSEHHEWVGNITNLKDGDVEVTWADGTISMVGPQAIYVVGEVDDENTATSSDGGDDSSDCGISEDHMTDDQLMENVVASEPEIEDDSIGFMTRDQQSLQQGAKLTTRCEGEEREPAEASDLLQTAETLCNFEPPVLNAPASFKGFNIVRVPLDHHFLDSQNQTNAARKLFKKVQQDWDILQTNLPEDIHVHVYEDRMELLRVVIVGAHGTPYQDGLFFFDLHLPPAYPDVPPSAYYHSGG
ncbi:putative ubiquitin-conjugating enzyme E2 23 [Orobanche gracilis]